MTQIINDVISISIKSLTAAVVLFALARLMGKKQISQLTFFDYIVGISIGSIAAAMSVDKRISVINGIASMIIWALFPIVFSFISIHSMTARRLLDGTPTVLIQNGKIIETNLKKSKFTLNDLLEELRLKDVFNIKDVYYAILETSGKLSVSKKTLPTQKQSVCINFIIDGNLMGKNMKKMNVDEIWLNAELRKNNIFSVRDVVAAGIKYASLLFSTSREICLIWC